MKTIRSRKTTPLLVAAASAALLSATVPTRSLAQTRVMGVDVSQFQGSITWSTVKNSGGKSFAFIRATRGGTTGTSPSGGTSGTGLARYDDPTFYTNISGAKAAGIYASPYHFARADLNTAPDISTGTDEANHFLQYAGMYMKPGYMIPVLDLEAGSGRSASALTTWAMDFSDTILDATGVRPFIYVNRSYAQNEVTTTVNIHPLWTANPDIGNAQADQTVDAAPYTGDPGPTGSLSAYGVWSSTGSNPWKFWQYYIPDGSPNPYVAVPGIPLRVDLDVGHGTTEWLKDFLVPAYWTAGASGSWAAAANWNSNNPAYNGTAAGGPPSRAPGNISNTPNLSGIDDTVILDNTMTAAAYTVTLDAGSFNIRKLYVKRPLNITGGSLTINYDPTTPAAIGSGTSTLGSTTFSAQFSQAVSMTGGALSVHTLLVDPTRTFTLSGGTLTLDTMTLGAGSTPAKLLVNGNVTINPLNDADALISSTSTSTASSATLDLGGATRTLTVGDGSAAVDLTLNLPVVSGSLTKAGAGTLQLNKSATFNSTVTVNAGTLIATQNNQLGTGVSLASAGALRLSGSLSYNLPLVISGAGPNGITGSPSAPGSPGALHALSGSSTWSGPVTLAGTGTDGTDPLINQVSAATGATLTLSGVISSPGNGALAKSDNGDLVLTGASPNTYTGNTHLYGGRIILEKDAALGTAASPTYQLTATSALAFRAPASSPAGFTYSTPETLFLAGTTVPVGAGQIDNLAGNNTFAGSIAIGSTGSRLAVSAGSLTVTGGLYGTTGAQTPLINKVGAGTLVLAGVPDATPPFSAIALQSAVVNVREGTLELRSPSPDATNIPGAIGYTVYSGATLLHSSGTIADTSVTVSSGGTFRQTDGRLQNVALTVTGGLAKLDPSTSAPSLLSSLSLTGSLDLTSNDLAIDYATTSPADTVRQYLLAGRNNGTWTGPGIISSSAATDPQLRTAIAYADASLLDTADLAGTPVDPTTLLLKYTYYGDANLDGKVNADDFTLIDRGFATHLTGWTNGDFDYDNAITSADYLLIDRVFAQQSGTLSPSLLSERESQFGEAYVSELIASIPEPSSLACLFATLPLLTRRRTKS